MKKKSIVLFVVIVVIVIIGLCFLLRPKALGNINAAFDEKTTSVSNFSFAAEKGERVKFSFRSDIAAGDLEIKVYDSNGNEVYVFDDAKALETFFTFADAGTYTLRAEYTDFIGSFKVAVYPASEK